jgi:hypothetical protein
MSLRLSAILLLCVVGADQPVYAQQSYHPVSPRYADYSGADAMDFAPMAGHPGYMLRPATAPDMGGLPPMLSMAPGGYPRMPTAPSQVGDERCAVCHESHVVLSSSTKPHWHCFLRLHVAHVDVGQ